MKLRYCKCRKRITEGARREYARAGLPPQCSACLAEHYRNIAAKRSVALTIIAEEAAAAVEKAEALRRRWPSIQAMKAIHMKFV